MKQEIRFENLSIGSITPDDNQPRRYFDATKMKSLKDSISKHGIITPLVVQEISKDKYLLTEGERRYRTAKTLGLKTVPAMIEPPISETDRLLRQFHLHEHREAWTPVEKAVAISRLSKVLGISLNDTCKLINVPPSDARRYVAFDAIIDKNMWVKNEIPLPFTQALVALKNKAKHISKNELEKEFTIADEKKLEHRIIAFIKEGTIKERSDISQIGDAFVAKPNSITEFMSQDISPAELYIKSKAKGAHYLRRTQNLSGWITTYVTKYLTIQDVKPTAIQIEVYGRAHEALGKLLKAVQK